MGLSAFQVEFCGEVAKSLLGGGVMNFSVLRIPEEIGEFIKIEHAKGAWEIYLYIDGAEFNYDLGGVKVENRLEKWDFQGDLESLRSAFLNEIDDYCRRVPTEPVEFPKLD